MSGLTQPPLQARCFRWKPRLQCAGRSVSSENCVSPNTYCRKIVSVISRCVLNWGSMIIVCLYCQLTTKQPSNTAKVTKKQMRKNLQSTITLLFIVLFVQALHAAPLKTLSLDFTRELTEKDKTERIAGTLHYDVKAARVVVEVTKPLKQIMVAKGNILEIYYPEQKQAFRFISEGQIPLPLAETIIQSTQAEYALTAIGYTLDKHNVVDEVLYTYWATTRESKR